MKRIEMNNKNWLETNFDPKFLDVMPVKIRTNMGVETNGVLSVDNYDPKKGKVIVSASYNSSPFSNMVTQKIFLLTQEQLDEFQNKGADCILIAPSNPSKGF